MLTVIYKSKTLTKHISCECKCKFGCRKCNSNQKENKNKCWCGCQNPRGHHVSEKYHICNPSKCSCKKGKYLGSIIDHSVIMCDEVIETTKNVSTKIVHTKTIPTNFNLKSYKTENFNILLTFLLVTVSNR